MATTKRKLSVSEIQDILQNVESFLGNIKQHWDMTNTTSSSWWSLSRLRLVSGTQFIISHLDSMIQWVEDLIPSGTDKKAAVLMMAGKLFDYIIGTALPIWLKPFAGIIRDIVINVVIGNAIDFIVGKYNDGIWKKDETDAPQETGN
jgi:hypothetical protein